MCVDFEDNGGLAFSLKEALWIMDYFQVMVES